MSSLEKPINSFEKKKDKINNVEEISEGEIDFGPKKTAEETEVDRQKLIDEIKKKKEDSQKKVEELRKSMGL